MKAGALIKFGNNEETVGSEWIISSPQRQTLEPRKLESPVAELHPCEIQQPICSIPLPNPGLWQQILPPSA